MFVKAHCRSFYKTSNYTKEIFLFEIFFHFSPIKTFPFGLFLMKNILVFQVTDPNPAYFFLTSECFALAVVCNNLFQKASFISSIDQ